jgi:hypothetical protein
MLMQKDRWQEQTPARPTVPYSRPAVAPYISTAADPRKLPIAAPGMHETRPQVRILTTLYDLIETMQNSMSADAEGRIVATVVSLLDAGRIKFLSAAEHTSRAALAAWTAQG